MTTAIIIVNYQTAKYLKKCLRSVFKNTQDFKVILVQNSPDEDSIKVQVEFQRKYPDLIHVITHGRNLGFVGGINSAFEEAIKYEKICLLNSDVEVTRNWLAELNKLLDDPEIVQISPDTNTLHIYREPLLNRILRRTPLGAYKILFKPLKSLADTKGFKEYSQFYEFPGGYCNVFKSEFFKEPYSRKDYFVDPNIIHGYWDEFDLTNYLRLFGKVGWTDNSYVYHYYNVSFNKIKEDAQGMKEKLQLLNGLYVMQKWKDYMFKSLSEMPIQVLIDRNDSYVVKMALSYLGILQTNPNAEEYINSIPAKEIGEKFLK